VKRRAFLKSSACFSVAVALGPACATSRGALRRDGALEASAWIRFYPDDRVVFSLDKSELGQGVYTSHTMMVAEELNLEPSSIEVELAPADPRLAGPAGRGQSTGASTSTKLAFKPLRERAAAAREALVAAAADHFGVTPERIFQDDDDGRSFRVAGRADASVRLGALIELAPKHLRARGEPKPRQQWRWLGKPHPRLDARAKTTGEAVFGVDVDVPGLRYASVWRGLSAEQRGQVAARLRVELKDSPAAGVDVVELSEGVALVGANTWEPMQRLKTAQASEWGQAILRSGSVDNAAVDKALGDALADGKAARARDDGDWGRAEGENALRWRFSFPYVPHQTMEPMNATAHVHRRDGEIVGADLWVSTQGPDIAQAAAARVLGIDAERVRTHTTFAGGGFGRRGSWDYVVEPVELSAKLDAPVRVTWSREDDIQFDWFRPASAHRLEVKVDGGEITGWYHRVAAPPLLSEVIARFLEPRSVVQAGIARFATGVLFDNNLVAAPIAVECASDLPYAIKNLRVEHVAVDPGLPITFWRANGAGFNAFVFETAIDEVARQLERDAIDFRLRLLGEHPRHRAVLEAVREASGWGQRALPAGHALGVALVSSYDSYVAQVAEVSVVDGAPRVHRVWVAIDCGIALNPDGVAQQMESGVIYGLSAALHQRLDFAGGRPVQSNFHDVPLLRMHEAPDVETIVLDSDEEPTGVGEPGVPPIAPAVANALRTLGHGPFDRLPLALDARAS
jgi:isoquinoline 1-oxidoreductase/isoquinoline 1-oxidoreductase beta subunit